MTSLYTTLPMHFRNVLQTKHDKALFTVEYSYLMYQLIQITFKHILLFLSNSYHISLITENTTTDRHHLRDILNSQHSVDLIKGRKFDVS